MSVDLRHLEHFVVLTEERNFTRAARRVHIVQSGLSVSIKALERELGAALFTRTTTRVELTSAGEALLPEARRTLAAAAAALESVAAVQGVTGGTLTIGCMQMLFVLDVVDLLSRFHSNHPGVKVRLRQAGGGSATLADDVRSGELDLAFLSLPPQRARGLHLEPMATEPLLLVCPSGHLLARRNVVRIQELTQEVFVDFPLGWGTRAAVDATFADRERLVDLEVNSVDMMFELVRRGMGLSFAPESARPRYGDLAFVRVRPEPVLKMSLATAKDRPLSPAASRLLALIRR